MHCWGCPLWVDWIERIMNDKPQNEDRYTVPGLARGLQLLMQFNRDERELSGAELSRRMGLPRASVCRDPGAGFRRRVCARVSKPGCVASVRLLILRGELFARR